MSAALPLATAWRIARRDLSARFKGLRLLLVCLFLGVGALAAIGTLTKAIERELQTRGQLILGGDLQVAVWQRVPGDAEMAALRQLGRVSSGTRLQAMVSAGDAVAPVELKAIDANWPLYGRLTLKDGRKVGQPDAGTAWIGEGVAARLGVDKGGTIAIGPLRLTVAGIIADEPDRLGEGMGFAPPVIVREDVPYAAGLIQPGAMYRSKVRVAFDQPRETEPVVESLRRQFPSAGFDLRTRDRASPGTERFIDRLGEFLVLVGLAALTIAGIGIGGGVGSWLDSKRGSIAALKVLGATSSDIARITLMQVMAVALLGTLAGLAAGVMVTPLLTNALRGLLPVPEGFPIEPLALLRAALYGLLVALVFTAVPLARARAFPAMALLRARVSPLGREWRRAAWPVGIGLALIVATAMLSAAQPMVTALFLAGSAALLGLLGLLGWAVRRLVARLPRPANPLLRTALANLHRPGAQTGALVTALGFGLSAFVLLAAISSSLDANISARVPQQAPDYFVLDVPKDRLGQFTQTVHQFAPQAEVRTVPALRGAVLAYGQPGNMVRIADLKQLPEGAGPLRGERGLTYSDTVPEGNTLVSGEWWPKDYAGPPLVSIDAEIAEAAGLKVGDKLAVSVLGVEREVTIASLRRIDWATMGFNYFLVFSPNALRDAPHNFAATVDVPQASPPAELLRQLARAFPSSSVIETGPMLRQARDLLSQMSLAILAAASVAVLAGIAVLLGAIAAARAARTYDSVILRVLGASRRQLLLVQLGEYGLLAALLGVVALVLGTGVSWLVIVQMFEFEWLPDWLEVLGVLGAGLLLVLAFALAASMPVLRTRPSQALREL
ncbi:ABC transporter permease [Novosphingobium sp. TH158]|uniref:ABC transporter permease n=1 Tax=Novosphingobium sp. TH158 TaxID=2067455 RepID=UPI000C7B0187|nr:FtsX-like permease family protein [Novosphingobium sp. TH158]PLK26356.1 ABC transporter permease [Novosphingobium sp. TH158]